ILTLNNSSLSRDFLASITLHASDGTPFQLPDIPVPALQNIPLRLSTFTAGAGERFQEGNAEIRYTGPAFGLGAQMTVSDQRGKSFDMEPSMGFQSTTLEGLWWSPDDKADGRVMLTNTSDQGLDAALNVEWRGTIKQAKIVNLGP